MATWAPDEMFGIEYFNEERVKIDAETGCWVWQLSINPRTGYGQLGFKPYTAHRLAFLASRGREPDGVVRHRCHNRKCCNPDHLTEGSHRDNWRDSEGAHRADHERRRGHAPAVHPVTVDGITYPSKAQAMRALGIGYRRLASLVGAVAPPAVIETA